MQAMAAMIPLVSILASLQLEKCPNVSSKLQNPGSAQEKAREMKNTGRHPRGKHHDCFVYNTHTKQKTEGFMIEIPHSFIKTFQEPLQNYAPRILGTLSLVNFKWETSLLRDLRSLPGPIPVMLFQ